MHLFEPYLSTVLVDKPKAGHLQGMLKSVVPSKQGAFKPPYRSKRFRSWRHHMKKVMEKPKKVQNRNSEVF